MNTNDNKGIHAYAAEINGEFLLLSGSLGSLLEAQSFHASLRNRREQALESGQITALDDSNFRTEVDIDFSSPSAASIFLYGTSRNGATDWKIEGSEMTYGQWRAARVAAVAGPVPAQPPLAAESLL